MATCFGEVIGDTLRRVAALHSPVVRTCHVGNNTANNWGWLQLARNTLLLQYDHTLYGVDDVCLPWLVLGDRGRVEADFDFSGQPRPEHRGKHATEVFERIPGRHHSVLCHGIFAGHEGDDVFHSHWKQAVISSRVRNGSAPSCDSADYLANLELAAALVGSFAELRRLDLLFDRWVRTSRRGVPVFFPLEEITYLAGGGVTIRGGGGTLLHAGNVAELIEAFAGGLRSVAARVCSGVRPERLSYPWPSLAFGYLWTAVKERRVDRSQDRFFHAGGSASQYYVNEQAISARLQAVKHELVRLGFLGEQDTIEVIPTHCCQLFATTPDSEAVLGALLEEWHGRLARRADLKDIAAALGETTEPVVVTQRFLESCEPETISWLAAQRATFNQLDQNRLPIAHVTRAPSSTYNKYGISQRTLAGNQIFFPEVFRTLRWFEAELLTKCLAELASHEAE
jgi:hypothetical protein